jgi:hypothetical protein
MNVGWPKSRPADVVRSIVFFGLLYLYVWLVVQPCLIYSCGTITNFPIFYKGWPFFGDCMSYPGGLLRYLCALLPQFFYYSWAGALVITGQAWAISACTGWLLRALGVPGRRVLRFVPALLVLVTYAQYSYHFPTIMGSVASLLFGCLYISVVSRSTGILPVILNSWAGRPCYCVAVYLVLSVVAYVVSAAAYLPFAALCAIYELLYRRRYGVGLAYLLSAAILPYLAGVLVFHVSIVNAYTDMLPLSWQIRGWVSREKMITAVYSLYLFPIVIAVVWRLWQRVAAWWKSRQTAAQTQPVEKKSRVQPAKSARSLPGGLRRWVSGPAVRWTIESSFLLGVGGAAAVVSLDGPQKALLAVHYYACHRMWPEVLQAARRCPDNYTVMNAVDRALYYTGRLNRDMFTYLQHPDALMITGEDHSVLYWHKFDTLIDLGLMNLAEKDLTECMETFGEHPMILQRLAMIDLVKGKIEAGRIYLGRLQKTLFFSTWAKDYLVWLEADPTLATDLEIQQLRTQALRKDSTVFFFAEEPMLSALVEQGGQNRMAFEYLMAWYMTTKQLEKLAPNLARLTEFGYTEIPPLYQEAAVIYAYGTKKPVPLKGLTISPEAQRRIEHFTSVFNRYGRNKDAAFGELAKDYAGSYFFYFVYASPSAQK